MTNPVRDNDVPVSTCANCHVPQRPMSTFYDPLTPPRGNPVHAIPWPTATHISRERCHGARNWPTYLRTPHPQVQLDPWWVKHNYLDAASTTKARHLPVFRAIKINACIDLNPRSAWLGPWYVQALAGLELRMNRGARICFTLVGDRRGLILNGTHNPLATIRGLNMDSWSESATPRRVNIYDQQPMLLTDYTKTWYHFWRYRKRLNMNPLINFRDKIPLYYRVSDNRRLSLRDYREIYGSKQIDPHKFKPLPLLHSMVTSGRVPPTISFDSFMKFINVWSRTWAKKRIPETLEERIAKQIGDVFTSGIGEIRGTLLLSPETIMLPGVFVRFSNTTPPELRYVQSKGWPYRPDNTYMARATFSTGTMGQLPHHFNFNANIKLDQLYVRNFIDLGNTSAEVQSSVSIEHDGSIISLAIPTISAYLNPFRYGAQRPGASTMIETTGGYIYGGRSLDGFPSGFHLTKNKAGEINTTLNLVTRTEIRTPRGNFSVRGDLIAGLKAQWIPNSFPRIVAGRTHIEIQNFRIYRQRASKPLVAGAKLIITDDPSERKILAVAHPRFRTGSSGFFVRLEFDDLRGIGYRKGYVVGFIPVPRDATGRYYDPRHFSMQHTLNLAFGLVTKGRRRELRGNLTISRLASMAFGRKRIAGTGIEVRGNIMSVSRGYTRHLVKNGHMKIISRWVRGKDGKMKRRWFALIRADRIQTRKLTIYRPYLRAHLAYASSNDTISFKMHRLYGRFLKIRSRDFTAGRGMLSGRFALSYRRRSHMLRIWHLGTYFRFTRLAPRGLLLASRRRFTSFDIDGYLSGNWRHNLRTNRGRGWISLVGDKEGDIHLRDHRGRRVGSARLGRETPLFSDTRWIALRIDGVDRRGWIRGQFCLRTDIDLMALRPMGVRHSDYIEWIMSHDNIALPKGIMARSQKYYRDLLRGKLPSAGTRRRADVCRRIFSRMK